MRIILLVYISLLLFSSCQKNDTGSTTVNPPVTPSVSEFKIISATRTHINEVDIKYVVSAPATESYSDIYLQWSTTPGFSSEKDSLAIADTRGIQKVHHLTGLKQATTYYCRIALTYKGIRHYSENVQWSTDTFKILSIENTSPPRGINKGGWSLALTNLGQLAPFFETKIFLGQYQCSVIVDYGHHIEYIVPADIPAGRYSFRLITRGMEATAKDSLDVLKGEWGTSNIPPIPINPVASTSGLYNFGTCFSAQNGYLLGGTYFNGPQVPYPNNQFPEFIFEFNGQTKIWSKKYPTTFRPLKNPICYYFNNSIYVIATIETLYQFGTYNTPVILKKMLRLDLSSLDWHVMNDVPYPTIYDLTSFELNNEWYIGMGSDSANRSICCGEPLPSKKFWKFNPTANQWTQLADFPGGHQNFPTSFSIGSKGYVFYGAIPIGNPDIATTFRQELWEYDPVANGWTQITLPATGGPPAGEKYQIITYNNKAYFLTGQVRMLLGSGYGFWGIAPGLEWDPLSNLFKRVSYTDYPNILKPVFKQANNFYFQTDALGYYERIPNKSYTFTVEQ